MQAMLVSVLIVRLSLKVKIVTPITSYQVACLKFTNRYRPQSSISNNVAAVHLRPCLRAEEQWIMWRDVDVCVLWLFKTLICMFKLQCVHSILWLCKNYCSNVKCYFMLIIILGGINNWFQFFKLLWRHSDWRWCDYHTIIIIVYGSGSFGTSQTSVFL